MYIITHYYFSKWRSLKKAKRFTPKINHKFVNKVYSSLWDNLRMCNLYFVYITMPLLKIKQTLCQKMTNSLACGLQKYDHVSQYQARLGWLPIDQFVEYKSVLAMFYQHYLGSGILIHLLNLVISAVIKLDSHHGLWIFLAVRHALVSVFSGSYIVELITISLASGCNQLLWKFVDTFIRFDLILVVNFVDWNCFCLSCVYILCIVCMCVYIFLCVYVLQYGRMAMLSAVS